MVVSSGSLTATVFVTLRFHGVKVCEKYGMYFAWILLYLMKFAGGRQTLLTVVLQISLFWYVQLLYVECYLVVIAHVLGIMHCFTLNDTAALCRILLKVELIVLLATQRHLVNWPISLITSVLIS